MKRVKFFFLSLLLALAPLFSFKNAFANTNDFYFKDITVDYYLSKAKDGSSVMEVVETFDTVFPNYNQNHGLERKIPFLNQNDTNLITESTDNLTVEVTRNGEAEPVKVAAGSTYFNVRIGDADTYVKGEQIYVLKYKYIHTITSFELSGYSDKAYQELYWDAFSENLSQSIDNLTVNLHMDGEVKTAVKTDLTTSKSPTYKNKSFIHENNTTRERKAAWCYIGKYGANGQDRCTISDLDDGIQFNVKNLSSSEGMTIAVNFENGTFYVPENDFIKELKIKEATIDYYLSKDEDGLSRLKTKETIVADFPTLNEVYKFSRSVFYANGARFITDSQEDLDVKVTLDGKEVVPELTTDDNDGRFIVDARDENSTYLHGEHTFIFEYEQKNVIEDKSKTVGEDKEEIEYQDFRIQSLPIFYEDIDKVTANIHLTDDLKNSLVEIEEGTDNIKNLKAICDDGSAKEITEMGCAISETDDGYKIVTYKLASSRSLISTLHFKKDTFFIPDFNRNYLWYYIFFGVILILGIIVYFFIRKNAIPVKDKISYLKNKPVAPQYSPILGHTVAELAEVYLKPTKNPKVATMLELIIEKKIELVKGKKKFLSGKYTWKVKFKDLTGLSSEQSDLIEILNNGSMPIEGNEKELTSHSYSSALESAFSSYDIHVKGAIKKAGWTVEEKKKEKDTMKSSLKSFGIMVFIFFILPSVAIFAIGIISTLGSEFLKAIGFTKFSIYEGEWLKTPMIIIMLIVFAALPLLSGFLKKYKTRTEAGLDITNYLDGLKLYIKMAEADRMKFLQSVEGVDTSEEGIVKLNEKLLPYAALFGLEKSWMRELESYYELHEETSPDWYVTGFNLAVVDSAMRSAVSRPIDMSSSGGDSSGGSWSSSSSSSGGGGGGFSGGGGGGGSVGGW